MVHFVAKQEHFKSPAEAWFHNHLAAIPINREKFAHRDARKFCKILGKGGIVLVYPEGPRRKTGAMLEFKKAFL